MRLEIRRLTEQDQAAFTAYNRAMIAEKAAGNAFIGEVKEVCDFVTYLTDLKRAESETDRPDWSTATAYFGFLDGKIVGRVVCRWQLVGDLPRVGGHIGYAVHKSYRGQGYASQLLGFALDVYRSKGYDKVLITALVDNPASRRVIEKAGGLLENIIALEDGMELARYWIDL